MVSVLRGAENDDERKYHVLMREASDGISISDDDGNLLEVNPKLCELLGYTEAELLRLNVRDLVSTEGLREPLVDFAELQSGRPYLLERRLKRADGTLVAVEVSTKMLGDGRLLAVVRDITERKRAEEALRAREEQLRAVVDASPLGIVALDREGKVTMWNRAAERIFGWREEEVLGKEDPIVPKDSQAEFRALYARALRGEGLTGIDLQRERRDGSRVDVALSAAPLFGSAGEPVGAIALIDDVTERRATGQALRESEERLRRAQKLEAIGRLVGGIAHDFNNLLTVILASTEFLLQGLEGDDHLRRHANEVRQASERAAVLIHQLLAFSRRQVLQPRVLELNEIVAGVANLLRRLIGVNIELMTQLAPDLGRVKADPGQLEQVLTNLVVNARDAMPEGGKLTIATANVELDANDPSWGFPLASGLYVALSVADTGIGMDADTQARVFEPFFTMKEPGKGTGLGLSTVYGIVKQSGGYIALESKPGAGSTFRVYLPPVEEPLTAGKPSPSSEDALAGDETVLIAESDDTIRELLREALEQHGYRALAARDGREALAISKRNQGPIHLLITDLALPGMSGRDLAARHAALRRETAVLYTSGYTDEAVFRASILEPGAAFLHKPFTAEALTRTVRELLDSRPAD